MSNVSTHSTQSGFGLIEVMVSLLVVATGVLGILGMQTLSLQHNAQNFAYTQANFLAQDYFNRLLANADQVSNSKADFTLTYGQSISKPATDCSTATCTATQMAKWDMYEWQTNLANSDNLPSGKAASEITVDASGNFAHVVLTIRFLHNHKGDSITIDDENAQDYEQFQFERNI